MDKINKNTVEPSIKMAAGRFTSYILALIITAAAEISIINKASE